MIGLEIPPTKHLFDTETAVASLHSKRGLQVERKMLFTYIYGNHHIAFNVQYFGNSDSTLKKKEHIIITYSIFEID